MAAAATQAISIVSVFLSYSDKDRARAGRIAEAFNSHGIDCFFAFRDEKPLQEWEGRISREILERRLFILLYTTNSRISAQVRKELDQAQVAHKEIWMIKDTDAGIVGFITDYAVNAKHAFDICEQSEDECVSKVLKAIHERWLGPNGEVRTDNCPYPGTQSFRRPDPQFPFARHDSALADLKHLISDRWDAASRLVLVHGPSGAGKTSLLRAGLKQELSSSDIFYDEVIDAMDGSLLRLLKATLTQLTGSTDSVDYARLLGMQFLDHNALLAGILDSIRLHRQNRFVFCFDQMEEFFGEKSTPMMFRSF